MFRRSFRPDQSNKKVSGASFYKNSIINRRNLDLNGFVWPADYVIGSSDVLVHYPILIVGYMIVSKVAIRADTRG